MIRYNTGFMEGFVTEDELKAIAPEVENASKALRNGTGLGNDFIGWRDLPGRVAGAEISAVLPLCAFACPAL